MTASFNEPTNVSSDTGTEKSIKAPAVSVMLCTNQIDSYFEEALLSLRKQTLRDIEIVVVANGLKEGQDQQLKRICTDSRIRVFFTAMQGVTFSRNLALHEAKSDLIAVLDADDIAYPERLSRQYDFMVKHPEVMVLGGNYDSIDADGKTFFTSGLPLDDASIRKKLVTSNPICHPTTMFRKQRAMVAGGYGGGLAQDYELWIRLLSHSKDQFVNLPDPLIGYRVPVVSKARMSRRAYAQVASSQWRQFVMTKQLKWGFASIVSAGKAWFRSRQG